MKVFISGPMSGMSNYNRAAFFKAQKELERKGYSVWNPAWLTYPSGKEFTKDDMHIIDLAALRRCDAIYMLKGWKYSKGAREEREYAAMRGLTIMYEEELCYSFRFNLSKVPEKNAPVFDQEFALDEEIKNRTNYQLEAIKENIKEKYSNVNQAINDVDRKMNNRYADNLNKINSLRKEVKAIKESIGTDNLQEQLDKDFDDVYTEFSGVKDQVNDINMGYIKWSSEVSQFDERIEKLEENMKEIAANGGLGLSFNLMNARVSSNKRDISSIKNDIATIKDSIDNQRCTLDVISERVDNHYKKLNNDIDDIHNWINSHDKMLEAQSKQMSDLGSELDEYIDDYKEAYKHLDNADEALERRIKALEIKAKDFDGWFDGLSGAIDNCSKSVSDIQRIINSSDIENISIKAMNDRMNLFSRELDSLSTAIDVKGKDIGSIVQKRCDDNRTINNTLNDLNYRLKAIEKRLSIKPFYEPTEDEKEDD